LSITGIRFLAARLGEESIQLARYTPSLIILDMQLPDISGLEAARRLKADEQTRAIPIIAVTAFALQGDEAKVIASGCDAYVPKPLNVAEFVGTVARYTRQARRS
jgi:two-component system cell cycle response regulator DivK